MNHCCSPLISGQNSVQPLNVWAVVDYVSVNLYPRMCHKGHCAHSQNQFGCYAFPPEQPGSHCRALQTEAFFGIPEAGFLHGSTYLTDGWQLWIIRLLFHRPTLDRLAERLQRTCAQDEIEYKEADDGLEDLTVARACCCPKLWSIPGK